MKSFKTEKWIPFEFNFKSLNNYDGNVLFKCEVDVKFTSQSKKEIIVPAFWTGKNNWCIRFSPDEIGKWTFETLCEKDVSLNGIKGELECTEYNGNLEIYKRGFLKTEKGIPYFMYNDGTPFFYLGDTHWSMAGEEFDSAGDRAGDIKTDSRFKYLVDRMVDNKFTVYQSEPIGEENNLEHGFDETSLPFFENLDRRFKYIAEKGLVHANAMMFFTTLIYQGRATYINNEYQYDYLEKLARYWVARYSCYPVLWTIAQECDRQYNERSKLTIDNNPWVNVAEYTYMYDPYKHPLTAHMECIQTVGLNPYVSQRELRLSWSIFKNLEGHTWYGIQAFALHNKNTDYDVLRDAWENSQGKVMVLYEGQYENLGTMNYGARVQGWYAYLNGWFGYGYGAQDIWLYNNDFVANCCSDDGHDCITPELKAVTWADMVKKPTFRQLMYMRQFFEALPWWNLRPDLDYGNKFKAHSNETHWAVSATKDSSLYVAYIYGKEEIGKMHQMNKDVTYTIKWFNPRTNEYTLIDQAYKAEKGEYIIPQKPDDEDWVIFAQQNF